MNPFTPEKLPPANLDWSRFIDLVGKANRYIARYDGLLQSVVNPDILLSPLKTQEAVLSSKIEGTQATLEEVMEYEAGKSVHESKQGDIKEVINYRIALAAGRDRMEERPLSLNVIKQMHQILMQDVRGGSKDPGNFRRIQNWIGSPGSKPENARFVPPSVPEMHEALDNWEKYLHKEEKDVIVQLAVIHAQFEIIHPFMDGNGRIGRILIPLFLFHKKVIYQPVFYMSQYLENNRPQYYDALKNITENGDWNEWISFFMKGFLQQAEKNIEQVREVIALYEETKNKLAEKLHSQYSIHSLDFIFTQPIFSSTDFQKRSGVPKSSGVRLLKLMESNGIIQCIEKGSGRKPGVYAFRNLLQIVNK